MLASGTSFAVPLSDHQTLMSEIISMAFFRIRDEESVRRLIRQTEGLLLVNFWAEWSDSCQQMVQAMQHLLPELTSADRIVCVDHRYRNAVFTPFNVIGVPTLLVFKGGHQVARFSGVTSETELCRLVRRLSGR
jgi:thioredoxin-like negative regulator of GroEL